MLDGCERHVAWVRPARARAGMGLVGVVIDLLLASVQGVEQMIDREPVPG